MWNDCIPKSEPFYLLKAETVTSSAHSCTRGCSLRWCFPLSLQHCQGTCFVLFCARDFGKNVFPPQMSHAKDCFMKHGPERPLPTGLTSFMNKLSSLVLTLLVLASHWPCSPKALKMSWLQLWNVGKREPSDMGSNSKFASGKMSR